MRKLFRFLRDAYTEGLGSTLLAKDQTHFYTMSTSIVFLSLLDVYEAGVLSAKLIKLGELLENPPKNGNLAKLIGSYLELSQRQTSTLSRREGRQKLFREMVEAV